MANVLRVPALEIGHPVPLLVLMKSDDPPLHQPGRRNSMYVERGGSVVNPNFS